MKVSYSRIQTFNDCPFKYRLIYLEHLEPLDDLSPDNPLFVGTAVHEGIEKQSVEAAIENYKSNFPEITEAHEFEIEKLKAIVPRAIEQIPLCEEYEHKLDAEDEYVGFIDGLVKNDDGTYNILDFKCSNNVSYYVNSPQVHIYKYYFERLTENKVKSLYYVFIPKPTTQLNESLSNKNQILEELSKADIRFEKVDYDQAKVNYFFAKKALMEKSKVFLKRTSGKCNWCPFKKFCQSNGLDRSELKESSLQKLDAEL